MRTIAQIAQTGLAAAGALALAACDRDSGGSGTLGEAPAVPLVGRSGQVIGDVRGGDSDEGATLLVDAKGLPAGEHGLHVHDVGLCEGPAFESAGPHWNPAGRQHGGQNPQGAHMGDLENVTVGEDGRLRVQIVVPGTYLRNAGRDVQAGAGQILDASGAALVLHARPDDYRTDPSGNSGDRIACAVLGAPERGAAATPPADNTAAPQDAGTDNVSANETSVNGLSNAAGNEVGNSAGR